jgi:Domain of unknown function (DUF1707)
MPASSSGSARPGGPRRRERRAQGGDPEAVPAGLIRLGDSGRETAVGVLKRAFAEGQPTQDEFEARVVAAYRAAIRADLCPWLEDLPEYQIVRSNPRRKGSWLDEEGGGPPRFRRRSIIVVGCTDHPA